MRASLQIVLLFLACFATGAFIQKAPDPAGASRGPIPATFFGMHIAVSRTGFSTPILPPVQVNAMGKPVVTDWEYLERSRGVFTWDALDKAVAFARDHHIPIFVSHEWVPAWATSDTSTCFNSAMPGIFHCPAAPKDENVITACTGALAGQHTTDCMWKEFLTALVNRYKSSGVQTGCPASRPQCHGIIQMYEGWNEPPYPHPMSLADFVTFETDFLNTVRENDPQSQVCSPAFIIDPAYPSYATFMKGFFDHRGPRTYDCYDFHISAPEPEAQLPLLEQFKQILADYALPGDKPLYATEAGIWGECNKRAPSADRQQAYIGRIELLYWSWGVSRHYLYAYDTCATLTAQPDRNALTPAGIAYGNIENWMIGATMTAPCASSVNQTTWTCGLTRPGGYQALAVWSTSGDQIYTPEPQYKQYRDLSGGISAVHGPVRINAVPILLESLSR